MNLEYEPRRRVSLSDRGSVMCAFLLLVLARLGCRTCRGRSSERKRYFFPKLVSQSGMMSLQIGSREEKKNVRHKSNVWQFSVWPRAGASRLERVRNSPSAPGLLPGVRDSWRLRVERHEQRLRLAQSVQSRSSPRALRSEAWVHSRQDTPCAGSATGIARKDDRR